MKGPKMKKPKERIAYAALFENEICYVYSGPMQDEGSLAIFDTYDDASYKAHPSDNVRKVRIIFE